MTTVPPVQAPTQVTTHGSEPRSGRLPPRRHQGGFSNLTSRRPAVRQVGLRAPTARHGNRAMRRTPSENSPPSRMAATRTPAWPLRTVASASSPSRPIEGRNTTAPTAKPVPAPRRPSPCRLGRNIRRGCRPPRCRGAHGARLGIAVPHHFTVTERPGSKQVSNSGRGAQAAHRNSVTALRRHPRPRGRPHFTLTAVRGTRQPSRRTADGTGRCRRARRRGRTPTRRSALAAPGRQSSSTAPFCRSHRSRRAQAGG